MTSGRAAIGSKLVEQVVALAHKRREDERTNRRR